MSAHASKNLQPHRQWERIPPKHLAMAKASIPSTKKKQTFQAPLLQTSSDSWNKCSRASGKHAAKAGQNPSHKVASTSSQHGRQRTPRPSQIQREQKPARRNQNRARFPVRTTKVSQTHQTPIQRRLRKQERRTGSMTA